MLKRFLKYYKPYKGLLIKDILASFFISLTGMLYPIITRKMLNDFIPNKNIRFIVIFGVSLLVIYLVRAMLRYFVEYYGHIMGLYIQADLRKELFDKLQRLPFDFFDNNETGSIMSRITNDLFDIVELAHHGPENIIMSTLTLIFAFIYLSTINFRLALIIFASVPLMVFVAIKFRKRMRDTSMESKKAIAKINAEVSSSVSGIRVTKAFNNSKTEAKKFNVGNEGFVKARKEYYRGFASYRTLTLFITDIFNVICLISGGIFLYHDLITFGDYSAFIVSVNLFIEPITKLVNFSEQFEEGATGFERFTEIMDEPEEVDKDNVKDIINLNGDIEFRHVSFSYKNHSNHHNTGREVLDDVSFKLEKGKTLALVGPSGGGKTTICHLLPRFYEVDEGEIMIDGININDISMRSLRANIGIVQQDVFLFSGSFYENILYGKTDASEEEVIEAAKKANIYDYIMSLPEGFETEIGERGVRLSGGQKQRLSIARVFLKNPSILILDEATSALDNTTELLIQEALNTLQVGRTTLVVAHRLSTIKNADEIMVVANGKIIESGTHDDLMKKVDGTYKMLYDAQYKEQKPNVNSKLMMS